MIRNIVLFLLVLAAGPSGAGTEPSLRTLPQTMHGTWGYNAEACVNPADDGRALVEPRAVTFFASHCSLTRFRRSHDGSVTGSGRCRDEGETAVEPGRVRFRLESGDRLVIAVDDGEGHTYERCERPLPVR
ncbi:hypothetical protein ACJ4V0_03555 [Phreatobacter sp. HK31-P]